jgi:predicted deacylase
VLKTNWPSCISHTVALYKEYIHVRNLASQVALPLVVQSLGQQGSLSAEAAHEGIPAVDIELRGGRDQVDSQAAVEVREAILNYMRIRDMIPGERIESSPAFTGRMQQLNAESEGFFIPRMNVGEPVQADDVIGTIQDKGDVRSPHAGVVVMLSTLSYVFEGDVVARIAPPASEQKNHTEPVFERAPTVRRKW